MFIFRFLKIVISAWGHRRNVFKTWCITTNTFQMNPFSLPIWIVIAQMTFHYIKVQTPNPTQQLTSMLTFILILQLTPQTSSAGIDMNDCSDVLIESSNWLCRIRLKMKMVGKFWLFLNWTIHGATYSATMIIDSYLYFFQSTFDTECDWYDVFEFTACINELLETFYWIKWSDWSYSIKKGWDWYIYIYI